MDNSDRTVPLSSVPVGARVVHAGKMFVVKEKDAFPAPAREMVRVTWTDGAEETHLLLTHDTYVYWLEGDEPRPLAECVGRDVWSDAYGVWLWYPWPDGRAKWWDERGHDEVLALLDSVIDRLRSDHAKESL